MSTRYHRVTAGRSHDDATSNPADGTPTWGEPTGTPTDLRTRPSVVVSACLAGVPCRYNGRAKPDDEVIALVRSGKAVAVCAEDLAGMGTPRSPAEIVGGDGHDVLDGTARVITIDGEDVTDAFIFGAETAAALAMQHGATEAILQANSPSCGCGQIYDGTHTGSTTHGDGVFAAALARRRIPITPIRGAR